MIKDLIRKEIIEFLEDEDKRRKERDSLKQDPLLKKAGIEKNYLELVENAIAEKDLDKAKGLRDELEVKIAGIEDATTKDKAATIGIEVNNIIDMEEKIIKNKKDFEMRIKDIKGDKKSFFTEKKEGLKSSEIQKMFSKGISKSEENTNNSFFTSKPDKVTVVQNFITPEQPYPSSNNQGDNIRPIQIMPQRIRAELVKDPKEGHENEFNKATFLVNELSSFLKEKEWQKARDEYNSARDLIESLPDCEDKTRLMNELFKDYHEIRELEKEWKKEQEELKRRQEEEQKRKIEQEQKRKQEEERKLEEQRKKRYEELQQKEQTRHIAHKEMQKAAQNHLLTNQIRKEEAEEIAEQEKQIKPPLLPYEEKTYKDIQQRLLEAKHEQILSGGSNTSKFIQLAQENLNHDRALRKPQVKNEEMTLPKKSLEPPKLEKDPEEIYKKAVSLIYEGNKKRAKELLTELLKMQPTNIAVQIRLKECES